MPARTRYRRLHRALLGDSCDTGFGRGVGAPARLAAGLADPTLSDRARRARRLFAVARRGQPACFRRKLPESDRLVRTRRDMWLVPLKPFAGGQLPPRHRRRPVHPTRRRQAVSAPPAPRRARDVAPPARGRTAPAHRGRELRPPRSPSHAEPPLGVLARLSGNGLLEVAGRLDGRPAAVVTDHDRPDENGVRPGIDAGRPPGGAGTEGFDVWDAGETAPLVEGVRNRSSLFTTTTADPR